MLKIIIWGCVLYLLYKFVFDLVVPIGKATSEMKQKINAMQQEQQQFSSNNHQSTSSTKHNTSNEEGDYIDFEELKK
jgi:Sec-independent protein translocase protein TatA